MRRFTLCLALACGAPLPLAAQQTLTLTNGDRLTGTLAAVDGGTWVFRHASGELQVPVGTVATFAAPGPLGIRLTDGTIAAGRIDVAGGAIQFVPQGGAPRTITPGDLAQVGAADDLAALAPVRIGYFSPLARFWSASTGFGFSSTTGNTRSRGFAGDFEVRRESPKDRLQLGVGLATNFSAPPGVDTLEKVVEKYYGLARVDEFLGPRFFLFAATRQDRDTFQGIDLRSNYSGGAGVQLLSGGPTDLRFYASGGYRREAFVTDSTFGTPVLGGGGALMQQLGPAVLAWAVDWTPRAEDLEDYRLISTASVTTTVFRGLGFRVASRNEVNNNPPPGIEKHDWLLTTTLTYTVGR